MVTYVDKLSGEKTKRKIAKKLFLMKKSIIEIIFKQPLKKLEQVYNFLQQNRKVNFWQNSIGPRLFIQNLKIQFKKLLISSGMIGSKT